MRTWDWTDLKRQAERDEFAERDDDGDLIGRVYLGTVQALTPSGKIYVPFVCSTVSATEAERDEAWHATLERVAEEHNMWITGSEGSSDDLFLACIIPMPECMKGYKEANDNADHQ